MVKTEETSWESNGVFPVGLNFNVAGLTNLSLCGSIANNTRCLSEVSLIGNNFDTTSFGDGDEGSKTAKVDPYGCSDELLVH